MILILKVASSWLPSYNIPQVFLFTTLTADPVNIKNPPSASVNKEHHPNTFSYLYFYAKHKKLRTELFFMTLSTRRIQFSKQLLSSYYIWYNKYI